MAWRESLLTTVGPGAFSGVTLGDWLRVLRENNYSIDWPYWGRAAAITTMQQIATPKKNLAFQTTTFAHRLEHFLTV
jgi:hypothetical protein